MFFSNPSRQQSHNHAVLLLHLEKYFSLILLKPNLHNKIYEIINKNCAKVIIGTDQWDAGCWLARNDVTPFNVYEETLKTVMS